ncbi:hypothetical protein [Yeguia hominis]|uniref:hypothetical protein n=1 Tax=Yeguia hominis TaxID=2763662 RepID=UPI0020160942
MKSYGLLVGVNDTAGGIESWVFCPEENRLSRLRQEDAFPKISYLTRNAEKTLACVRWMETGRRSERIGSVPAALCRAASLRLSKTGFATSASRRHRIGF